ncbi:MAG: hypothetical protein ABSG53_13450 [Thermoguttaceae bacterium]|jgi:hypothetical protein
MNDVVLLAAGGDLSAIVVVIVFIIIPLIGVVASKMREMAQPTNPVPPGRSDSGRIQEQIDEFLRRAAQRRGGQPAAPEPKPAEIVADEDVPVGGRVGQQVQAYMDTSDFRRRSDELGGEVAQADQQFTKQVGQAFSGEVGRLASRPGEAAQQVEVVEVEVAEPEYLSRPTLDALPLAGSGLAELLGSPENIAQAVIMAEILRRPDSF